MICVQLGFGMSEVAAWYQDGSRVMVAVVEWRRRWPKGRQRFGIVVRQKPCTWVNMYWWTQLI